MAHSDEAHPRAAAESGDPFTRRHFLELLGIGAIGVVVVGSGVLSAEYLSPNVVKEPPTRFKAGMPESYPPGSVTLDKEQRVFIVRAKEGYFYALSATCTHLGCIANWKAEEGIVACPCHGSKFSREGNVIAGPAPRALPRYAMSLDDHGQLVVDKGLVVGEEVTLKV
ncbi:MAG TPA: Rieske (2Fe-2S) protein [Bacteroidota bacterium]|nr:Rieske (2Fe-2S) protein [Bacteroidota bacterium]